MSQFTTRRKINPELRPRRWVLWSGAFITLFFFTNLNDPFNAPKSWALSIAGFWLIGWIVFQAKPQLNDPVQKLATYFVGAFVLALTIAFIATDNKFIGFFGEYQRRTGYLTYLSLTSFLLAASYLIRLNNINSLYFISLIIGTTTGLYGLAQHFGHDPVHWNNPYNSVLSTLGNPDFAAAIMAIFAVLNFGILIQSNLAKYWRALAGFNVILLFIVIQYAQVRQGLLVGILGIDVIVIVWIYQRIKIASYLLAATTFIVGIFGIAGMLKMGPLTNYFYKTSVTYRGDYWRAGWRMFFHNPIFGVGLDRYGANFRHFRDNTQVIRRGPDLVSNAAHNVPIQLASTGGALLLITYVALTGFILWRGFIALKKSIGATQIATATVFGAWLAYQAQSIISIDNIGIAIWGYILGGVVIGLSVFPSEVRTKPKEVSILQPVVSPILAVVLIVIAALFFQSESAMRMLRSVQVPKTGANNAQYLQFAEAPLKYVFKEPSFELISATSFAQAGQIDVAIGKVRAIIAKDPNFYEAYELLAQLYEFKSDWKKASEVRQKITVLDPYNPNNLNQLKVDSSRF